MATVKGGKSESAQAEEALRDSESRYRRLFETAKDGILILDAVSGQITDVNPFLVHLLGYSHEEFLAKKVWEIAPFHDGVENKAAFKELKQKLYIRYEELPLETKGGEEVDVEFVSNVYGVNGKKVIQCNIRDISERKLAKDRLKKANTELSALVHELQSHEREMRLTYQMNDLLQTCKTKEEAYQVIGLAAGELFAGQSGGLAVLHESGYFLETFAQWGDDSKMMQIFSLDDCWAMRRGQQHLVVDQTTSVLCSHFVKPPTSGYLCLPLVVQGDTIGLLHIEMPDGMKDEQSNRWRQMAVTIGDGIKLSLSNLKLRTIMGEQATHDPLTGLFNRRYLSDTLPREINHARRHQTQTCIAMLDIDHFKAFNDTYGHEAGDLILRELGRTFLENMRESDIVCRYGGEEFLLVLIDSSLEASIEHIKKISTVIKEMQIRYGDQLLGSMTISAGVVEASQKDYDPDALLKAADKALYAAKKAGRDRVVAFHEPVKK